MQDRPRNCPACRETSPRHGTRRDPEVALPAVSGQHDSNATVTALSLFASCPRKYYLSRYLGFDGRVPQSAELGARLRRARRSFRRRSSARRFTPCWPEILPEAAPEARRLAEVFLQSPLGRRAARATRVAREFDF